jgi:hypothetical protein
MSTTIVTNTAFVTPRSIAGLSGWYDGNDPLGRGETLSNGFPISQWSDKSGNVNHATQLTSLNQPFLSNGGIVFRGAQNLNFTKPNALASNTTFSIFLIEQRASSVNTNHILAGFTNAANQNLHIGYNTSTQFRFSYFGNDFNYNVPEYSAVNEPFRIWSLTQSATMRTIFLNGAQVAQNNNTGLLQSWNGGSIGRSSFNAFGTNPFYHGTVNEIIFYKPILTITQQQQIEGYLAWKWTLQRSLPVTHPFFNNPQQSIYPYTLLRTVPQPKTNVPAWSVFNPLSIPTCSLWLDATDTSRITFSGSNIISITDKASGQVFSGGVSPNYIRNLQNGQAAINFSGSNFLSNTTYVFPNTTYTVFSIQNLQSTVGNGFGQFQRVMTGNAGSGTNNLFYVGVAGSRMVAAFTGSNTGYNDVSPISPGVNNSNVWRMLSFTVNSSILLPYIDGSIGTQKTGTTGAFTGLVFGAGINTQFWNGYIGDFLIYSSVLTAQQRQQVEGWLTYKWGLQPNLAVSHPAKTNFLYKLLPAIPVGVSAPATINTNGRFAPTSLPGLALWLDAADTATVSLSGSSVTQWRDKSGNGRNAIINGTVIYNNLNVITNGVSPNSFFAPLNIRRSIVPNLNIFIVYNQINTSNPLRQGLYGNDIGGGWNRFQLLNNNGTFDYRISAGFLSGSAQVVPVTNINNTNKQIYNASYSLSNINSSFVFLNGTLNATFTEYASQIETTTSNIFFGTINNGDIFGNVNFNEIIIFTRTITTTERQQIEGYLAWKWGLRSSLPSTHPNAFMPP